MKFRKKPVVIEAFKLGYELMPGWFADEILKDNVKLSVSGSMLVDTENLLCRFVSQADIKTLEGTMHADDGDYVIKGVKGEIYPCKPDIFEATYEKVEDDKC